MSADTEMADATAAPPAGGIDEGLYSRQLAVFGTEAQAKMQRSTVLMVGLRGTGVEVAKNVILAGVREVGLLDAEPAEARDLSAQFYLKPEDVGRPRAAACFEMLRSLNTYVRTHVVDGPLSEALLDSGRYQVVVLADRPLSEQLRWGDACRARGIRVVCASAAGLLGSVMVDAGAQHTVSDKDGERPARGIVTHVTSGSPGVVTVNEDKRHGLETGDWVTFEEVEGMSELNSAPAQQVKVRTPFSFEIGDTTAMGAYTGEGYFNQVKRPETVSHLPLREALAQPDRCVVQDVYGRSSVLLALVLGLGRFADAHGGRAPRPDDDGEVREAASLAAAAGAERGTEVDEAAAARLLRGASAVVSPMAALLGGVAGQEVLKLVSGKFTPLNQVWLFDAADALPSDPPLSADDVRPAGDRYDDQVAVFGRALHERVRALRLFLIGAGAIGCEMIKNMAMMGAATAGSGAVHLTDMDQIEKSNLNRQFLFRPADVGRLKSEAAAGAARAMNPDLRVDAKAERVGADSEGVYNDEFWESLDCVVTALDNVEARLYVDQRCLYFQKPMLDSGTQGTKGNTQVVVPFLTESYGSSRDPPEESIPICTLKNFPNQIEHTIQWARDLFEGLFKQGPDEANAYLSSPTYLEDLEKQTGSEVDSLRTVLRLLVDERPLSFEACVEWARALFEVEFSHKIRQLLHVFPPDSVTASGSRFWSGKKRAPAPVDFDASDEAHLAFVVAAANLRAFNFGIKGSADPEAVARIVAGVKVPAFVPKQIRIATTDEEAKQQREEEEAAEDHDAVVAGLKARLPDTKDMVGFELHAVEFEKDDDTNFHMDFIAACSNLRARNYRIKEESKLNTKFIAGKIIPAIATTTALVTGLVCLELLKVIQGKPLEAYRNTYVNLALPLFTLSEPFEPARETATLKDRGEWRWSIWDKLDVDEGDITLQQYIDHFKEKLGLTVSMISAGRSMLYYHFGGPVLAKFQPRLGQPLSRVIQDVTKTEAGPAERFFLLETQVTDDNDEDVEIPSVRFKWR